METAITITAVDGNSSDSMSRTFATDGQASLKDMVEVWENEDVPYRKYELVTPDYLTDYEQEVQEVLDELEISN